MINHEQPIYFCLRCQQFYDLCECCEPPGQHDVHRLGKLNLQFGEEFVGTLWDQMRLCDMPVEVLLKFAKQAGKKIDITVVNGTDDCVRCNQIAIESSP